MTTYDKSSLLGHFQKAKFLISAQNLAQCPRDEAIEVAFAGRSNAGKSSAINAICQQTRLARTSKTPGRTQLLNFFSLGADAFRLVDLPGYGYAQVPLSVKKQWQKHLTEYLLKRKNLIGLVLVMDIRHPLSEFDLQMLDMAQKGDLPTHILLTKEDKLKNSAKKNALTSVIQRLESLLPEEGSEVTLQTFSALKKTGLDDAREHIWDWLNQPVQEQELGEEDDE